MKMPLPSKGVQFMGKPVRKFLTDEDGDGFPNPIDCSDKNPNKQGPLSWIIAKVQGREHDEVDRERLEARHEKQMSGLERQEELESARERVNVIRQRQAESRIRLAEKREALERRRRGSAPKFSMGYGGFSYPKKKVKTVRRVRTIARPPSIVTSIPMGFGIGRAFGVTPTIPTVKKKRKSRRKKRKR